MIILGPAPATVLALLVAADHHRADITGAPVTGWVNLPALAERHRLITWQQAFTVTEAFPVLEDRGLAEHLDVPRPARGGIELDLWMHVTHAGLLRAGEGGHRIANLRHAGADVHWLCYCGEDGWAPGSPAARVAHLIHTAPPNGRHPAGQ